MRGHIRKRGNSWAVVVYLGRDPQTGKPRQKWYSFPTRREAEAAQARLISQLNAGVVIPNTKHRLGDYLDDWLRGHAPQIAPTTFDSYEETIRVHLAPSLGHIPLPKLTPQSVRDYITTKLAAGLSPKTVGYHRTILRRALEQATRDGLIVRNAAALVQAPRKERREPQTLDSEQAKLFLGEARRRSPYYRLYLTALLTGLRQGELLGLRWRDCDLTFGRASIVQTFYRRRGNKRTGKKPELLFKAPKTSGSTRAVPFPPELVAEFLALRDEQAQMRATLGDRYHDNDLVFCQPDGKPLHAHNIVQRDFRRMLALDGLRADMRKQGIPEDSLPKGLPRIRFHDLRHSHATMLLQLGIHPKVVQERLGHSNISMTLDTYSHVLPGMQEEAARRLAGRVLTY